MKSGLFILFILLFSCGSDTGSTTKAVILPGEPDHSDKSQSDLPVDSLNLKKEAFSFSYNLNEPNEEYKLPEILTEISGISFSDPHLMSCVQDEKGNVYQYDLKEKEIIGKFDFGKKGDYEGITQNGKQFFMLRSDGTIFIADKPLLEKQNAPEFGPYLIPENDAEGLAIHPKSGLLLIACKGKHVQAKQAGGRMIFALNPKRINQGIEPYLEIDPQAIRTFIEKNNLLKKDKAYDLFFDKKHGNDAFQTSDIAIHPKTKNLYAISSAMDKFLLVFNPSGKLIHVDLFKKKIAPHPEGISFDEAGTLYLSSEGREEKGKILTFKSNTSY